MRPCLALLYRLLQHSLSLGPVLFQTTRTRGVAAAVPGLEDFTAAAPFMPVGAIALEVRAHHIPSQVAQEDLDIPLPVVPVVRDTRSQVAPVMATDTDTAGMDMARLRWWEALRSMAAITIAAITIITGNISVPGNILTTRIDPHRSAFPADGEQRLARHSSL
jgi:hypothetical protein